MWIKIDNKVNNKTLILNLTTNINFVVHVNKKESFNTKKMRRIYEIEPLRFNSQVKYKERVA